MQQVNSSYSGLSAGRIRTIPAFTGSGHALAQHLAAGGAPLRGDLTFATGVDADFV
jgi:hypothetical protein